MPPASPAALSFAGQAAHLCPHVFIGRNTLFQVFLPAARRSLPGPLYRPLRVGGVGFIYGRKPLLDFILQFLPIPEQIRRVADKYLSTSAAASLYRDRNLMTELAIPQHQADQIQCK